MESVMESPQNILIGFLINNVNYKFHDASTFDLLNVAECYCKVGSEFYPEDRMNNNYGTNNHNKAFVNFNKTFKGLSQNIKSYINHRRLKSSDRLSEFDTKYQNGHLCLQPIQLSFIFTVAVADVICHALVITRKVISAISDG